MKTIEIRVIGGNLAEDLAAIGLLSAEEQALAIDASKHFLYLTDKQHVTIFSNSELIAVAETPINAKSAVTPLQMLTSLHKQGLLCIQSINSVVIPPPVNKEEKLADDLGQIIFRLETNFQYLKHRIGSILSQKELVDVQECRVAVALDIERLKTIKTRILE